MFSSRKRLSSLVVFGVVILTFAVRAYTAKNYTEQNYPSYSGNFAVEGPQPVETLTVVSYNIWFGEDIDQAMSEMKEIRSQKGWMLCSFKRWMRQARSELHENLD